MSDGPLERIMSAALNGGGHHRAAPDNSGARRNRAKLHDDERAGSQFDEEMLKPVEFSELDRGNLTRIAVAIEELNQTFKTTAKIEITNNAIDILAGLKQAILDLNRKVADLAEKVDGGRTRRQPGTRIKRVGA